MISKVVEAPFIVLDPLIVSFCLTIVIAVSFLFCMDWRVLNLPMRLYAHMCDRFHSPESK